MKNFLNKSLYGTKKTNGKREMKSTAVYKHIIKAIFINYEYYTLYFPNDSISYVYAGSWGNGIYSGLLLSIIKCVQNELTA